MKKKLLSRKFLLTTLANIVSVVTLLTGQGGQVGMIASILVIILTTAIYVITEGKIDAASVKTTLVAVDQIMDIIENYDKDKKENKKEIEVKENETKTE